MDESDPVKDGWPPPRPGKEADDGWPPPRSEKGVVVEDGGYHGRGKGREMVDRENGKGKKRVRETDKDIDEGIGSLAKDPLIVLGPDILLKVLSHLDAFSAARALLVSRGWQRVSSSDLLWRPMLDELSEGKAHLPRLSMTPGITNLQAYSFSFRDGKRSCIMKEDLCDHVWQFHFSKTAPEYWRNLDPFWNGSGPPMRRYFHKDGSVTADPDDKVWGGHECSYSIVTSVVVGNGIRQHYVRINRWPPLSITRNSDWSWTMENQLCCYSSLFDAEKPGGTGPLFPRW